MPIMKLQKFRNTKHPENSSLSIKDFYSRRNKILIIRGNGGLGDILMHRMIFEDFKRVMPEAEIHFACPQYYHDAVRDHPFIDKLLDLKQIKREDYTISYNTSTECGREEMRLAPFSGPHRSDIWAGHCGVSLQNHSMHIKLSTEELGYGRAIVEQYRKDNKPIALIAPISAMTGKDLLPEHNIALLKGLKERGVTPVGLHVNHIKEFLQGDEPQIRQSNMRLWMAIIQAADYVISVDTAAFHCAGGLGKPLMGIFTFADGNVYGKYFDFVLVQRHRNNDPTWTCGPCYNWCDCPKSKADRKPCLTEITPEMLLDGVDKMLTKWPANSLRDKDSCLN